MSTKKELRSSTRFWCGPMWYRREMAGDVEETYLRVGVMRSECVMKPLRNSVATWRQG